MTPSTVQNLTAIALQALAHTYHANTMKHQTYIAIAENAARHGTSCIYKDITTLTVEYEKLQHDAALMYELARNYY